MLGSAYAQTSPLPPEVLVRQIDHNKETEILLNGAVGIVGVIVGAVATLLSNLFAESRRRKREAKSAFELFQFELARETDNDAISNTLHRLREFMLNRVELLQPTKNRDFFKAAAPGFCLSLGKAHSRLGNSESLDDLRKGAQPLIVN